MATTTNYGWPTPDDTDLVKDGADAIRTLGSSIDSTTEDLNPATTEGDMQYASATAHVNERLAIGTAGQVLQVNSGADAPEWATPAAGGGMELISTTTLTGASVTLSSIPATFVNLQIVVRAFRPNSDGNTMFARFNNDALSRYAFVTTNTASAGFSSDSMQISGGMDDTTSTSLLICNVFDYANISTTKMVTAFAITNDQTTPTNFNYRTSYAFYNQTGAINSVTIGQTGASFSAGQVLLYGVK